MPPASRRSRAKSRLRRTQIDRHHTHTTTKSVWIAAIAAIPATILATATLLQTLHLEQKVDGRLTQLIETTRREAAATATINEKNQAAATTRQDENKPPVNPPGPGLTYTPPAKSGN
jgi:hypothetical protein